MGVNPFVSLEPAEADWVGGREKLILDEGSRCELLWPDENLRNSPKNLGKGRRQKQMG